MRSLLRAMFAPQGAYAPCGMFTPGHITALLICLPTAVAAALLLGRRMSRRTCDRLVLGAAVLLTVMEGIKIAHAFAYGDAFLDSWVPLSFCSIFMLTLWLYRFGGGVVRDGAATYLAYAAPVAGLGFLIFPATSLVGYPVWHFLSLHSLIFHSLMIFLGLTLLLRTERLTVRLYLSYAGLLLPFCALSVTLNTLLQTNFMGLRRPHEIPIRPIQTLAAAAPPLFTAFIIFLYLLIPIVIGLAAGKLPARRREAP